MGSASVGHTWKMGTLTPDGDTSVGDALLVVGIDMAGDDASLAVDIGMVNDNTLAGDRPVDDTSAHDRPVPYTPALHTSPPSS